jgi:hypothetical protein
MKTAGHWDEGRESWEHVGRAAERFARRVARDAHRFARNVEEHVGELAHEMRREWRCGRGATASGTRRPDADVRRVFEDVRGVLAAILDGIDELVTDLWSGGAERGWSRVVCNRDATCGGCARPLAAGAEAWVRRRPGGLEFRCLECGAPKEEPAT